LNSRSPYYWFLIPGLVYLLFPTQNANIDSWYYAACVKHNHELINSHHLLYNLIGRGWYVLLKFFNADLEAFQALNRMNAIAATLCLLIFYQILLLLGKERKSALWLSLLCGVSFGFMRYSTDAETYILPLLFSLVSTYFFLKESMKYNLLWSALFSVIAILIHQLHICWAFAMVLSLVFTKPFSLRSFLTFSIPLLLIPLVYYIAYLQSGTLFSFWQFIIGEYGKGNASLDVSIKSLGLTLINLVRSFIQVHGQIADLFLNYPVLYSLIFIGLLTLKVCLFKTGKLKNSINRRAEKNRFSSLFFLAFIIHLIFAFLSSGNAEFMVMLPFLLVLYLASKYSFSNFSVLALTILIFAWNMTTAIIPARILDLNRVDRQVEFTLRHPEAYFVWKHKPLVENIITYKKGFGNNSRFIRLNSGNIDLIDSLVKTKAAVYTDYCNPVTAFSREAFLTENGYLLGHFQLTEKNTWENIYGENHIYLISKKGY
jgi:hypothetical protein